MSEAELVAQTWMTETEVADQVPIDCEPAAAVRALDTVPLWFHTFALNSVQDIYTPGVARDHGYRFAIIPEDFTGLSVLDVGAFDGFYSFLAEARGASRVLAVDNEQYRDWVRDRWEVELDGGEGFRAIGELLESNVEYRRMDATDLDGQERFDLIFCFGILHRVESPLGLLRLLRSQLADGGRVLLETHGLLGDGDGVGGELIVPEPGEVYPDDHYVYWSFGPRSVANLATFAGFTATEVIGSPIVDGHPRLMAVLSAGPPALA